MGEKSAKKGGKVMKIDAVKKDCLSQNSHRMNILMKIVEPELGNDGFLNFICWRIVEPFQMPDLYVERRFCGVECEIGAGKCQMIFKMFVNHEAVAMKEI